MNHPRHAHGIGTSSAPYRSERGQLEEHLCVYPPGTVGNLERLEDGRISFAIRQPDGLSHGPAMFLDFEGITYHLNLYEVCMAYGGPEEGGWYHDFEADFARLTTAPTPRAGPPKSPAHQPPDHLDELPHGRFEPSDSRSWIQHGRSMKIETHPEERIPKERPRYQ